MEKKNRNQSIKQPAKPTKHVLFVLFFVFLPSAQRACLSDVGGVGAWHAQLVARAQQGVHRVWEISLQAHDEGFFFEERKKDETLHALHFTLSYTLHLLLTLHSLHLSHTTHTTLHIHSLSPPS